MISARSRTSSGRHSLTNGLPSQRLAIRGAWRSTYNMALIVGRSRTGAPTTTSPSTHGLGASPASSPTLPRSAAKIAAPPSRAVPATGPQPRPRLRRRRGDPVDVRRLRVVEIVDEVDGARRRTRGRRSVPILLSRSTGSSIRGPTRLFRVVAEDRPANSGCAFPCGAPPPALFRRDGRDQRGASGRDRAPHRRCHGRDLLRHLSGLVLDMTNFATWIDSATSVPRSPSAAIPSRKEATCASAGSASSSRGRRRPPRQPRLPGNSPDVTQFGSMVGEPPPASGTRGRGRGPRGRAPHLGLRRRAELRRQLGAARRRTAFLRRLAAAVGPPRSPRHRSGRYRVVDEEAFPGRGPSRPQRSSSDERAALSPATRRPAREAVPGLRPDPRQGPPPARRGPGPPRQRKDQKGQGEGGGRVAAILAPRWVSRVVATTLTGEVPAGLRLSFSTDDKARAALETELFGKRILFSDKTPSRPRPTDRRRVPLPGGRRGRLPPDEGPEGRLVLADVPLHRAEDSRPCLLLRARPHGGEAHGARGAAKQGSTSRSARCSPAFPGSKSRAPLPGRAGTPPCPAHAHRARPHPAPPLRPLRPRGLRTKTLSRYYADQAETEPVTWTDAASG